VPDVAARADYRMGQGDLIEVAVWKEPALSATVPVRPDGRISLPMAGDLVAEGRTPAELEAEVRGRLARFVPEPSVSVMVHEVRSPRIFVLGEVAHPGAYPLVGAITVLEAMAVAGGTTEFARRGRLVVLRRHGGAAPVRIRVNLDEIVDGKARSLPLQPGDTVFVP
jgi:polysaccharide export outer membrane protein